MKYFSNKIINAKQLVQNYKMLKQMSNKKICAVVKANAYGHNAKVVVKILGGICDFFAVQNLYEALEIRKVNSKAKILVLGYTVNYNLASKNNISVMVDSIKTLKFLQEKNIKIKVHIKINTGMNRLGIKNEKSLKIMQKIIKNSKNIEFEGIFTHFYDTNNKIITNNQIKIFEKFVKQIDKNFSPIVHIGGSGMTRYNISFANYIRCGISLYGYNENFVKPIMKIESKIVKITKIKAGENVGYSCGYTAQKNMKIGLVPLGYADGVMRNLSNNLQVEILGKTAKQIGNICMDMFMVDLTNFDNVKVGDTVSVFCDANTWAKKVKISNYEVLTGLNNARTNLLIEK